MNLSNYAKLVQPSATLAAGALARQLRAEGVSVFDFSLGEPDFNTPKHICAAATRAMAAGQTHYTPAGGTAEMKAAVTRWYSRHYGWEITPDRVVITAGAKHGLHNALASLVGPGDEVIIPTPYWVSYSDLVEMTGAKPVLVPTTPAAGFKLSADQFRAARTKRTRLLLLNSPCNPTGTVYSRAELERLADAVLDADCGIISDEIYEQLCFGDAKPTCAATLRPGLADRTVVVSGVSKSFAMTGWRLGWAIAPSTVAQAMANIQSQETGCPNSISQIAAATALDGPLDCVAVMRREFEARRDLVYRRLAAVPGLKMLRPDGAFYAFFDVSAYFHRPIPGGPVKDSAGFCKAALETAHVNLVPGSAFGAEGYVRMSFATDRKQIEGGLAQLERWLTR